MKYSQGHDVAVLHCKQQQHLHHTYSLYHTFCLSAICKQRNKHRNQVTHTHTHTGSKPLPQTCKAKLIKGPLWLWWRRVRFPLTLHTAPLHKYLQAADWTRKEKKSNVFLFGSGLIPDGEMSWWKNSAGAFGQDGFAYHASELMHCWKCFGFFFPAVWDACTKISTTSLNTIQEGPTGSLQLPSFTSPAAFSPTA